MNSIQGLTTNSDPNIDGGWGWVIVFITFVIHVIFDGFMYTFGIFYAEFLKYFESTSGATSLVMAVFIGICYSAGPIASGLINKYGCRAVSFIGIGLACIGLLLSLAVPRVEYLYLTIGLIAGVGFGLSYLPTIVSVALFFERKRATAMGISMAGSGIGALLFAPLMAACIDHYQYWKSALMIAVGLMMQCFILTFFYRVFPPFDEEPQPMEISTSSHERHSISEGVQTDGNEGGVVSKASIPGAMEKPDILYHGSSKSLLPPIDPSVSVTQPGCLYFSDTVAKMMGLSLLKDYAFLTFAICTFLQYLGLNTPCAYMFHKSVEIGIASSSGASILLGIYGVSNTLGKIVFGLWADKTSINVLYLYIGCLFINGVSMMMTSLITDYYTFAFYCFVYGTTWGASFSLSSIVLIKLLGMQKLSNAYGLFLLSTGLATSIGVPLPGVLHDVTNSYDEGFYLSGGLVAVGALLLLTIPAIQRKFPQQ